MSQIKHFKLLSEYNELMNQRLYEAVSKLPDEKLKKIEVLFSSLCLVR